MDEQRGDATDGVVIVMAEDDQDYYVLARDALRKAELGVDLDWVENGEDCLDYLLRRGRFAARPPRQPRMVLLDLNMPRMNGYETLTEMKKHPALRAIPVVVLTASSAQEDVERAYALGACSFITKPFRYERLVEIARSFGHYWLDTVRLPRADVARGTTG